MLFFKIFYGEFVYFGNVGFVNVILEGLLIDELDVWMRGNNCVFLVLVFKLDCLYKEFFGVGDKIYIDCYINFIFL